MLRDRTLTTLIIVVVFAAVFAIPAYADFTSKSLDGKGQNAGMKLEAGGGMVLCGEKSEGEASVLWTLAKEEAAAILTDVQKWGLCSVTAGSEKGEATSNSCELEVVQPKEEKTVLGSVHSACEFTYKACEIKLESAPNRNREGVGLYDSGEKSENLILGYSMKHITTSVNSSCEAVGIKATKEATLETMMEADSVVAQRPPSEFVIGTSVHKFAMVNQKAKITVINATEKAKLMPSSLLSFEFMIEQGKAYEPEGLANCIVPYEAKESCVFEVKFVGPLGTFNFMAVTVEGANGTPSRLFLDG